jgi:predicted dehydrogenase
MAKPTVGIIGLGYGRAHLPAFQAHGCPVVAVCQRDEAGARKVAEAYGVSGVFTRWEEMLDRARPQVVVIATPPHLHLPIARAAFASGAHVLCEKPLALSRAESEAMADAARGAGRVGMTAFNWRFPAAMQRLNALLGQGAVGRPLHVTARWLSPRWADEAAAPTWRMDLAQAGHGAMGDAGVHLVDMLRWNLGEIRRVCAQAGIAYPARTVPGGTRAGDAEDFCAVLGELASGAQVTLSVSRAAHGVNEHALEVFGTHGTLAYRLGRETARWWEGELRLARPGGMLAPVEVPAGQTHGGDQLDVIGRATIAPLVARLLEAIDGRGVPTPSLDDGLRAQAVLDAVLESVRRRVWVEVT